MRTPREVAASYWATECRREVDGVMAHYQPDATYQDGSGLRTGHAEIRQFYAESARDYPGLEVRIVREYVAGRDRSAFEVVAVLIDHAGHRFGIQGLNAMVVRDGKIASLRCYEDPLVPEG